MAFPCYSGGTNSPTGGAVNHPSPPTSHRGSAPTNMLSRPMIIGGTRYSSIERSWVEYWLARRNRRSADIDFFKYACPEGEKYHRITLPNCDEQLLVTSTSGRTTYAPGSGVVVASHQGGRQKVIVGSPPPGKVGATNLPVLATASEVDAVGIILADPFNITSGLTTPVTLTGFGFLETPLDIFDAVKYDEDEMDYVVDSLVNLHTPVWVSATSIQIQVQVVAGAPEGWPINVRVERA